MPPKPLGEIWDAKNNKIITIYPCPDCHGPFAEIKSKDDLKYCPACGKSGFAEDETKPRLAVD